MSTDPKPQSKKDDIIMASIEIFANEGFDRPTMDSIATRASVSKRTLYKYFPNKNALLDDILMYLINQKQSVLNFTYNDDEDLFVQLERIITQKTEHILYPSNLKLARIILSEALKGEGLLKDKLEAVLKTEKVTLEWIEKAQKANKLTIEEQPLEILDFLGELINGVIFFPILFGKKEQATQQEIESVASMFLHQKGKS
ncbi:MAG: TetR/AcrR family transcriptional regulator [Bacteriovoracaceae bacterium]|nr:TetR/AcrR family transcriptional regulator [Bacteriovoracaceae bacterium]